MQQRRLNCVVRPVFWPEITKVLAIATSDPDWHWTGQDPPLLRSATLTWRNTRLTRWITCASPLPISSTLAMRNTCCWPKVSPVNSGLWTHVWPRPRGEGITVSP
jgi:hypothetical protein